MLLDQPISTSFGYAIAPLDLRAAEQHTEELHKASSSISIPKPQYTSESYQSAQWKRTSFVIPAASPRSSYSNPLCGGEGQDELPEGTYNRLTKDAKQVNSMPFFANHDPLPGDYLIGTQDKRSTVSQQQRSTLVVERLVPVQASRKSNTKVLLLGHGLGYCKETFLPLLDRLVQDSSHNIDQVWLIEALGHGLTSQLNPSKSKEERLSSEHRYVDGGDYARDMLLFLTCYLPSIVASKNSSPSSPILEYASPRLTNSKIIAIGHSFAGTAMLQLSLHLPDLFKSVAVIEPIIVSQALLEQAAKIPLAQYTLMKKDHWPSRTAARQELGKDRMTASWDSRVLDCFVAGGLVASNDNDQNQQEVERCCDRVAEALCIRGNRPAVQLGSYTLKHISPKVKVLYISAHKPMMTALENVKQMAEQIPNVDFQAVKGSHSLPQEQPDFIADLITQSLLQLDEDSRL